MEKDQFLKAKQGRLGRADKSSIGSWDKPITELCNQINQSDDYCTLSSCSGRIILIKETLDKEPGLFIFRSHRKVQFYELKKELEKFVKQNLGVGNENQDTDNESLDTGLIYLKQEPCVLAVSCRNLEKEQELLDKARKVGWKKSGITTTSGKFVVELFSTERIDVPIIKNNQVLVDDDYLKLVLEQANAKLERTWDKIDRLEKEFNLSTEN